MEIRKCNNLDVKSIYELICELKNRKFDYSKFEVAFTDKINNKKNYYIVGIENCNILNSNPVCIADELSKKYGIEIISAEDDIIFEL